MELIEIIINRRSIRHFKQTKVEDDKIKLLLRAAMYAPSAANKQPWHFIIIDNRQILDKIIEINPNGWMLESASHAILICGDEKLQHGHGYWTADCGAATENLLLAAKSISLGSCWIGLYPKENRMNAIKELFDLPEHVKPFSLIAIGYPDEEIETEERFRPDRIFYNNWGNQYLK